MTTEESKSAFLVWFEEQHGKRPEWPGKTDLELRKMVRDGKAAEGVLAAQERYDARLESALYAWQAREKQPVKTLNQFVSSSVARKVGNFLQTPW